MSDSKSATGVWEEMEATINSAENSAVFRNAKIKILRTLAREVARREARPSHARNTFPEKENAHPLVEYMTGANNGLKTMKEENKKIKDVIKESYPADFNDDEPTRPTAGVDAAVYAKYMEWSTKKETRTNAQEKWKQAYQAMTNWSESWREAGKEIQQEMNPNKPGSTCPDNPILNMWVKCDEDECYWTIAGDQGKPLEATDPGYATQYKIEVNVPMGIIEDNQGKRLI